MQGVTLSEGSACPACEIRGINSKLKFFRLNLHVAALLCKHKKCPFPLNTNHPDTFVRVGRDGKIIPGSQSERGGQHNEEDDSDDSPYISDASEESVTFPENFPEFKKLCVVSSKNTNRTRASDVDAFDISSIDFETDDSMDTFKLRNEITSLEMEITKSVENMKSVSPLENSKGSTVLDSNNENCRNPVTATAEAFRDSDGNVFSDTHRPLDINDTSYVKIDENEIEWCDEIKSGKIILREHDSSTSITASLELSETSEELASCMQQSEAKIQISDKSVSNNKHADIQENTNRCCQGGGSSDDGHHSSGPKDGRTIDNSNCSDIIVEKQFGIFSAAYASNPELKPSVPLIPWDVGNTVENDLSKKCELHAELVTCESVKFNDCGKKSCGNKEVYIICDDDKNGSSSDNNEKKHLDTYSMADVSKPKPEPSVLLTPQDIKNTVRNNLPKNNELHTELVTTKSVSFNKNNGCWKEKCDDKNEKEMECDDKEMDIISDDHVNSGCSDNIVEKQLDTLSIADNSKSDEELSVPIPQGTRSTLENDSPINCELNAELVTNNSLTSKGDNECGNKKFNIEDMDIIFADQVNTNVYEIVTIDEDTPRSAFLGDSRSYEVINLELSVSEDQKSSGDVTGRKTTKMHHIAQNASEQDGMKNNVASSDSKILTPSVKVKIVEEDGLFVCTANVVASDVSEIEEAKPLQKTPFKNKAHSKYCVCFLCNENNKKGITSHLDRALADLFPEEHPTEKHLTERELPTEREILKDLVHYMTGNSNLQNTKRVHRKRKRLFHL